MEKKLENTDQPQHDAKLPVSGWVRLSQEPNIGDKIIVYREKHKCYAEGVYEGKGSILTSPNCHFGSWDKWLLVEPCH